MTAEDRFVALAARAVGEEIPGTGIGVLQDDEARIIEDIERTVAALRGAMLPASRHRRAAVLDRVSRRKRGVLIRRIAAAAAVLLVAFIVFRSNRKPPVTMPPNSPVGPLVFADVFAASPMEAVEPVEPIPGSSPGNDAGLLRPFAAQFTTPLLVPTNLPKGCALRSARLRSGAAGRGTFSFRWLEYVGTEGRVVILQVEKSPSAEPALKNPGLPTGWKSVDRTTDGIRAIVASPDLSRTDLLLVSASLMPLTN